MTAIDENSTLDAGEWGVFVARAVQDIRRELGEAAASRVATLLHDQKTEAIDASREQLHSTQRMLAALQADVDEARRAHQRLQVDMARMEAAVRDAKEEAARVRADAQSGAAQRRAESDAFVEAESHRMAEAWEELHHQEADVAERRSQLLDLDDHAAARMAEIEAAATELTELREGIEADRAEAQRLVEEAIQRLGEIEAGAEAEAEAAVAESPEPEIEPEIEIDLRDHELDVRGATLDERERELDEWEAELVLRARGLDQRPGFPLPGDNISGWGRRRADD